MADYTIDGLSPEDAGRVRTLISQMAPTATPARIAFLPAKQYKNFARQVQQGTMGGRSVGAGDGSDERYGMNHTQIGDGISVVGAGQTWLNADLLRRPKDLTATLAHELGHYHAVATTGDSSEAAANRQRDLYLQRAQQAQKIDAGAQRLPVSSGLANALSIVMPSEK